MATGGGRINFKEVSAVGNNQYKVVVRFDIWINPYGYNYMDQATYSIYVDGQGTSGTVNFESNNNWVNIGGDKTFYVTMSTSGQAKTISASATLNTGISPATISASNSYTLPARTWLYTVAYNANGGSGAPSAQTKTKGETLTLSSVKPTRTGYAFQGWATSTSGGVSYSPGGSYTSDSAITLYAVWKANTYTVTYYNNGGSGAPSAQTKTYGVNLTLSSTKPTRTGYTFKGWATSATGGVSYAAGATFTTNATTNLYAVWSINSYTLTFNGNGGTPSQDSKSIQYQATYGTLATASRTGYTHKGWFTAASGGSQVSTTTKMGAGNVTVYAQWTANSYSVTFNGNGGTAGQATKAVTFDSTYGTLPSATRTGYVFAGWYTAASGGTQYTSSTKVSTASNHALYAHWTPITYKISFLPNDGVGSMSDLSMTYDETKALTLNTFTRQNHSFQGWATRPDGSAVYADGEAVKNLMSTTGTFNLYAVWKLECSTVTVYDATGRKRKAMVITYDEAGRKRYTLTRVYDEAGRIRDVT